MTWPEGVRGGTLQGALSWDNGYMGRFTLETITKPNAHSFPYSRGWKRYTPSGVELYGTTNFYPTSTLYNKFGQPHPGGFPYPLKPAGWTRSNDPFTVEARKRLAGGTA